MCPQCNKVVTSFITGICPKCYKKNYRQTHQKEIHEYNMRQSTKEKKQKWAREHKEYLQEKSKQDYHKNKERIIQWRKQNQVHLREWKKNYEKIRRESDPLYRIKGDIRNHISQCINYRNHFGMIKNIPTETILGCSFDFFKEYIENQFEQGMTWGNHGEWHLDHIKPLSVAQTEEEIYELCHYTNYQPLWAKDNLSKGRKIS